MSMRLPCQFSLHILLVMIMFDVYEASLSALTSYSISYDYV